MANVLKLSQALPLEKNTYRHKVESNDSEAMSIGCGPEDVGDLSLLNPVNSTTVLRCLKTRYDQDLFYTRAGLTLVAMNPFKPVPSLYNNSAVVEYSQSNVQALPPHIYTVAEQAYTRLKQNSWQPNQSIVVSGESGAGKTVTAKHLMRYLTAVSNTNEDAVVASSRIEQRILDSNPILEAFGNAKTLRNHNSSRFGKYIQLQFQRNGQVLGGHIKTYLLEKTRVVHQSEGECNFHIFYQFLASLDGHHQMSYRMASMCGRDQVSDLSAWHSTRDAMTDIGLGDSQQREIFQLITAVLCIGNLTFCGDEESSCYIDCDRAVVAKCLEMASDILGIDSSDLEKALTFRQIRASHSRRQSVFHKPCSQAESANRRDCLAKLLYSTLFDWLVDFINDCIIAENVYGFVGQTRQKIGLLDIYGFESFTTNSLEQMCINYANERLQQHFVAHFLRGLQEDYDREGIPWSYTSFVDNRPCLELLEGTPGIFALLNEECQLNRPSSDDNLVHRVTSTLQSNTCLRKSKPALSHISFVIIHYAELVQYSMEGVLDKNKDNVPTELVDLLTSSTNPFVAGLFSNIALEQPGRKKKTVLSKFKSCMDQLMSTLSNTTAQYVRCIKPNTKSQQDWFDDEYVMSQLKACGVTETVEIGRQAYPARIKYSDFLHRYGVLIRASTPTEHDEGSNKENEGDLSSDNLLDVVLRKNGRSSGLKKGTPKKKLRRRAGFSSADHSRRLCSAIVTSVFGRQPRDDPSGHKMGRTKIFLRDGQLEMLESARVKVLSKQAFTIQCAWRRYRSRVRQEQKMVLAARVLQAAFRKWLKHRKRQQEMKSAALVIERGYMAYRERIALRRHVLELSLQNRRWSSEEASRSMSCDQSCDQCHDRVVSVNACIDFVGVSDLNCDKQDVSSSYRYVTGRNTSSCADINGVTDKQLTCGTLSSRRVTPATLPKPSRCRSGSKGTVPSVDRVLQQLRNGGACLTYKHLHFLEARDGVLSRRHVFEGKVRFHTKVNNILLYGHLANRIDYQCSITDCLSATDIYRLQKERPVY